MMDPAAPLVFAVIGAAITRGLVHLFLIFRLARQNYGRRRPFLILEMRTRGER